MRLKVSEARRLARVTETAIRGALGQSFSDQFVLDIQDLRSQGHTLQFAREYALFRLIDGYQDGTHDPLHTVLHCPRTTLIGQGVRCKNQKQTQKGMPEPDALLVGLVELINELKEALHGKV